MLERLQIDDDAVQPLHSLPNLARLDLRGCRITKSAFDRLAKLASLTELTLTDALFSEDAVRRFQSERPEVTLVPALPASAR